jgi:hypothetical protein
MWVLKRLPTSQLVSVMTEPSNSRSRNQGHQRSRGGGNAVPRHLNTNVPAFMSNAGAQQQPPAAAAQPPAAGVQQEQQQPPARHQQPQQQEHQHQQQEHQQPQQQEHQHQPPQAGFCKFRGNCKFLKEALANGTFDQFACHNGAHSKADRCFAMGLIAATRRSSANGGTSTVAASKTAGNTAPQTADNTATSPAAPQTASSADLSALVSLITQQQQMMMQQLTQQQAKPATTVPTTTASTGTLTISKTMVMNAVLFAFIALVFGILYYLSGRR